MGLLKSATMGTAYAKIGILGFNGSGKTYTACSIATGIAGMEKANKVAFFDTEKGSDFTVAKFKKNGIELVVHKGRAFRDLITIIEECEQGGIKILIIDSISHVWRDLCDSYLKKAKRASLTMYDWNILKGQWKDFTDKYVNSKVHILMLGRAGYEYDMTENENGKKEIVKTGTKMKVEGETGFEPDLLIEMEREKIGDKIVNHAWVVKDRSDTMNGQGFDFPTFETFKPFFSFINIGGTHQGIDVQRNSAELFADPDWSYEERKKRREIALEELTSVLIKLGLDGTSNDAKTGRVSLLELYFNTSSRTAIEDLPVDVILKGIEKIKIDRGLMKAPQPVPDDTIKF